jgi:hypothetical protein
VRHVGLEQALDPARRVLGFHITVDVAAERGVGAEAAADQDVIALDRVGKASRPSSDLSQAPAAIPGAISTMRPPAMPTSIGASCPAIRASRSTRSNGMGDPLVHGAFGTLRHAPPRVGLIAPDRMSADVREGSNEGLHSFNQLAKITPERQSEKVGTVLIQCSKPHESPFPWSRYRDTIR